jgi:hypothetical protein
MILPLIQEKSLKSLASKSIPLLHAPENIWKVCLDRVAANWLAR